VRYGLDGHYFLLSAAGIVGEKPAYPAWLKPYLIVVVSIVWAALLIASVASRDVSVPPAVHLIMGVVVASLFRVEFGGIKLVNRKEED
jgi:hypothetical protein